MTANKPSATAEEAFWRSFLTEGDPRERLNRRLYGRLPADPRCRLCAAPFAGIGAPLMRLVGKRQSDKNPSMCSSCFEFIASHHGGAEIDCTMLFADIRGSTALAERMTPAAFHALLNRFYEVGSRVVFEHDGTVDKFVGDEVVALFFGLLAGDRHAALGIAAATALLQATGHADPAGPWVPVGAGVHTGRVWMGAVGEAPHIELTAVGDAVNTAARLSAVAAPGEVVVSVDAAKAAGLSSELERMAVNLKGKELPMAVVKLHIAPERAAGGR